MSHGAGHPAGPGQESRPARTNPAVTSSAVRILESSCPRPPPPRPTSCASTRHSRSCGSRTSAQPFSRASGTGRSRPERSRRAFPPSPISRSLGQGATARRVGLARADRARGRTAGGPRAGGSATGHVRGRRAGAPLRRRGPRPPVARSTAAAWHAFWGATLDGAVQAALTRSPRRSRPSAPTRSTATARRPSTTSTPCVVDRIARDRLQAARVRLGAPPCAAARPRSSCFLDGLTAAEPELPPHAGYAALERRLTAGSTTASPALRARRGARPAARRATAADDAEPSSCSSSGSRPPTTRPWPARLAARGGGDEVFSFLRASDPRRDLDAAAGAIEPLLAERGIEFDGDEPAEAELDDDDGRFFLREAMPRLEERGVPVLLPGDWVATAEPAPRQPHRHERGSRSARAGSSRRDALATLRLAARRRRRRP